MHEVASRTPIPYDEWALKALRRFGADPLAWRFVCPSCGHVASVADWRAAGAPEGAVAFSCVGRWTGGDDEQTFQGKGGPCTYAGGGLIGLNPVRVIAPDGTPRDIFAFVETDPQVERADG